MYKKTAIITAIILCFTCFIPVLSYAEAPEIDCPAAILIESTSGRILYEHNIHQKMYPASITKIMTAILALERGNLNDMLTASLNAVTNIGAGGSHIGILPGETLSLEDLLYGLMVASANDGANVIAEYISGSIDEFVDLMNQRAKELGALNTHFVNAHGMPDEEHFTTAYDMAMIAKYAMTIPKFREIVSTSYYEIEPTEKYKEKRYLSSTNHLINKYRATNSYNYLYEPAIGIKTGYTDQANFTLVGAARKNGIELITVVMGGKLVDGKFQIYEDTIKLLEHGFNNFSTQTLVRPGDIIEESHVAEAKDSDYIILQSDQYLEALLPNDINKEEIEKDITLVSDIRAPIEKGDVLGSVTYKYQGQVLGKVNLISDRSVEKEPIVAVTNQTMSIASALTNKLWFKAALGALGTFIIIILILKTANRRRIRRNRYVYVNDSKIRYIYKGRRK